MLPAGGAAALNWGTAGRYHNRTRNCCGGGRRGWRGCGAEQGYDGALADALRFAVSDSRPIDGVIAIGRLHGQYQVGVEVGQDMIERAVRAFDQPTRLELPRLARSDRLPR